MKLDPKERDMLRGLAGERWNPDEARAVLHDLLDKARGLHVEVILKDMRTVRGEGRRLDEWAKIAMKMVETL